jgi:phosphonate transport system substrate-binding protein
MEIGMLRKFLTAATVVAATFSPVLVGSAFAEPMKEVNFGIISTESSQNLKSIWQPFLDDMEASLGVKVNAFFAPDYAGIIEGMRFNKVDVAWFGNKSAMEAVDRAGGEIFAQTVDVEGNPGYWSVLVTHKDSPINSVDDVLKCDGSLNFGMGDPNSTSGYLVPSYYVFAQHGVDPQKCFKTVRNANHETNLMAAATQQVDVATNNTENLRRMELTRPEVYKDIKVVWRSPLIPADPIVWRTSLDEADKAKLMTFFMSYGRIGTPEQVVAQRQNLAHLQWAPFSPSSNDQLLPIRQLALFKDRAKVVADDKLSETERAAKLAEIDGKLDQLKARAADLAM